MKFLIICLFCQRTIQEPESEDAPISYGICEECKSKLKEIGINEAIIIQGGENETKK